VHTVVATPAFLGDARSLGLRDAERLAIVTWIAAKPDAGDIIEGAGSTQGCGSPERARERGRLPGDNILRWDGDSGLLAQHLCQERENRSNAERTPCLEDRPGRHSQELHDDKGVEMNKRKPTAGQRMIESARQALAFAKGNENHGCEVHVPDNIDVKAIREKISLSQGDFAKLFGLSKRTLEHWEHGRRVPSGPARAFLTVIAREPDAVRRALLA
jgi:putative transcriptional regulator